MRVNQIIISIKVIMKLNPLSANYTHAFNFSSKQTIKPKTTTLNITPQFQQQENYVKIIKNTATQQFKQYNDGVEIKFKVNTSQWSCLFFSRDQFIGVYGKNEKGMNGKAIFIYSEGVIVSCSFKSNQLEKWCISYRADKFIVLTHYHKHYADGAHFNYDLRSNLCSESQYRWGKLIEVKKGITCNYQQFLKMHNKNLSSQISELIDYKFLDHIKIPNLKTITANYYGQLEENIPNGFGIILNPTEIYFGHFKNGLLHGLGCIHYADHTYYFGDFIHGEMKKLGKYSQKQVVTYLPFKHNNQIYFKQYLSSYYEGRSSWEKQFFQPIRSQYTTFKIIYFPDKLPEEEKTERLNNSKSMSNQEIVSQNSDSLENESIEILSNPDQTKSKKSFHQEKTFEELQIPVQNKSKVQEIKVKVLKPNLLKNNKESSNSINNMIQTQVEVEGDINKSKVESKKQKILKNSGALNQFEWKIIMEEVDEENDIPEEHNFLNPPMITKENGFVNSNNLSDRKDSQNSHLEGHRFAVKSVQPINIQKTVSKEERMIGKISQKLQ